MTDPISSDQRTKTILGWCCGFALGLLLNYGLYLLFQPDYPVMPTTFVAVIAGAFLGMWLGERSGPRGVKMMGALLGAMLSALLFLLLARGGD